MKIDKTWTISFDEVNDGQCFELLGSIFIKAYAYIGNTNNIDKKRLATNLKTGCIIDDWTGSERVALYENAEVKLI